MTDLMLSLQACETPFRRMSGEEITDPGRIEECRRALREAWCSSETTDRVLVLADGCEIPWEAFVDAWPAGEDDADTVLMDDVAYRYDEEGEGGIRLRAAYAAPTVGPLGPEVVWDADDPERGPLRAGAATHPLAPWEGVSPFIYELYHAGAAPQPEDEFDPPENEADLYTMIEGFYTDSDIVAYGLRG